MHIRPLLGVMSMQMLIVFAVFSPAIILFVGVATAGMGRDGDALGSLLWGTLLLLIPTLLLAASIMVRLTLAVPAVIVENLGTLAALRRSWELVKGYWRRTFAILVVLGIFSMVASDGPVTLLWLLTESVPGLDPVYNEALQVTLSILVGMVFVPVQMIALALYYFDLRARKEGFDIEAAMAREYGR